MLRTGRPNRLCLYICLPVSLLAAGCASSSKSSTSPSGLAFVSPTTSPTVDLGSSVNVTVNESATFTLKSGCGNQRPSGTFSGGAMTVTGTTATYVAPTSAPSCSQQNVMPQDVVVATASSQTVNLAIFINSSSPAILSQSALSYGTSCPAAGALILGGAAAVAEVGAYQSVFIQGSGGVPPYTWTLASPPSTLPNGLTFTTTNNTTRYTLNGTPTSSGCSTFTVQVADSTAPANCNPATSSACVQATLNFVVVPAPLKVQVPNYPSAYNDAQSGNGVPYPPTALVVSGGVPPYFWCQDPLGIGATLPPGILLNSQSTTCATGASQSSFGVLSGTPGASIDFLFNTQGGSGGQYPTQIRVYDSQTPYPASNLTVASSISNVLGSMAALPTASCSQANQAPPVLFPTSSGSISVPPDSYLQGPMAFLLRGFDANGPVVIAGSVIFDGMGNVTGGTEDVTRATGHQQATVQAGSSYVLSTSSYVAGEYAYPLSKPETPNYSRGCMTLALADATTQASLSPVTFAFTVSGCSNHFVTNGVTTTSEYACGPTGGLYTAGHIIEFDDNTGQGTRASGILRSQQTASFSGGLSGPYAFGLGGGDATQQHYGIAGSFEANGGHVTGLAADIVDGGACTGVPCNVTFTAGTGTYAIDPTYGPTNGRWTATLSPNSQTSLGEVVYMVSTNEALVASIDLLSTSHPIVGGEALTTASSFGNDTLQNSQIFRMGGLSASGSDVSIGVLSFDGVGDVTGTIYEDQAGTLGTTSVAGEYSVNATTGRAVFSASPPQTLGSHPFVVYPIPVPANLTRSNCSTAPASCITGFLVGTDGSAQAGVLEFQTSAAPPPPPFINTYNTGDYAYGTDESLLALAPNLEGDVYAQPSSSSTTSGSLGPPFIQDVSYGDPSTYCVSGTCYLLMPNQSVSGAYTISSNGTGSFGGGVVYVTNGNVIFYIDESPLNPYPSVVVAEQ